MRLTLWLLALLALPRLLSAYTLTEADYATLKNDILVVHQSEFAFAVSQNDDKPISDAYNLAASPSFWVWRTSLGEKEIYETITSEGTSWDWTTFIQQSVQERDAWNTLFHISIVNPSMPQTRGAFTKIFSGSGQIQVAQRTHLLTISRRPALRAEALFIVPASGTGSTTTPAVMTFENQLRPIDVAHALRGVPLPGVTP